jgi:hypothetical protein
MIQQTYWATTNAEDIQMFHSLKASQRKSEKAKEKREKAIHIPKHLWEIIQRCHNANIGHWGVNRTIELIKELLEKEPELLKEPWLTMRRDVTTYIQRCDTCIKISERKLCHMTRKYVTSTCGVFENIAIDGLSLQETKNGYKHLLTIIDTATRYTVLKPLKDLTAKAAAQAMIEYMSVYGIPQKIQSDNSSQFMKEFVEMVDILRAENYKIQPYSHEENGMVERANKEIRRHLKALTYENRTRSEWDTEYMKVQAILNEKESEATGLKPNAIVFAGKVDLHAGRLYPRPTPKERQKMSEFMREQIEMQEYLIEEMEKTQDETNEVRLTEQENRYKPPIEIGSYVVAMYEEGPKTKMLTKWHGPYRVIKVQERPQGRIYTIFNAKKHTERNYHEVFIKPYPVEEGFTDEDAIKYSILDDEMFVIQKIIAHRHNEATLELLVQWYGIDQPEWKQYDKKMNTNIIVLQYLNKNGFQNLITREQKRKLEEEEQNKEKEKRVKFKQDDR